MCLAVPGRVREIMQQGGARVARVDFDGVLRDAALDLLPEVSVGEYVLVHVGVAISRVDEQEASRTLELLREAGLLDGPA